MLEQQDQNSSASVRIGMVRTNPRGRAWARRARRICTKIGPDLHKRYVNRILFSCIMLSAEFDFSQCPCLVPMSASEPSYAAGSCAEKVRKIILCDSRARVPRGPTWRNRRKLGDSLEPGVRKQDGYAGMPGRPHCAAFGPHRACCEAFKTQSGVAIENVGTADLNVAAGVPAWETVV